LWWVLGKENGKVECDGGPSLLALGQLPIFGQLYDVNIPRHTGANSCPSIQSILDNRP